MPLTKSKYTGYRKPVVPKAIEIRSIAIMDKHDRFLAQKQLVHETIRIGGHMNIAWYDVPSPLKGIPAKLVLLDHKGDIVYSETIEDVPESIYLAVDFVPPSTGPCRFL